MMNALKEERIESREMLLSIHHSLKMLLDIISKMNRKLEDERIKRDGKGKEKEKKRDIEMAKELLGQCQELQCNTCEGGTYNPAEKLVWVRSCFKRCNISHESSRLGFREVRRDYEHGH
ncbi:hypothetical protein Tco_0104792 [Tanacetum coccineum]